MKITGDQYIEELLEQRPDLNCVFVRLGLPCFVCGEAAWGTVADLCRRHGHDLARVLAALNAAARSKPDET